MNIFQLNNNLKKFSIVDVAVEALSETKETFLDLNRKQLLRGRDSQGAFLSPRYSQDPFFKSREAARRYAEWKKRIEPTKTDRPVDVPNLFINGRYHNSIKIAVTKEGATLTATDPNASKIEASFGKEIYGLNSETKKEIYFPRHFMPALKDKITNRLGLKFK